MSQLNALMKELVALWSGELDNVKVTPEAPFIVYKWNPPLTWYVELESTTEGGDPHRTDFTTRIWRFYDEDLSVAVRDALDFARALKAFSPKNGDS